MGALLKGLTQPMEGNGTKKALIKKVGQPNKEGTPGLTEELGKKGKGKNPINKRSIKGDDKYI